MAGGTRRLTQLSPLPREGPLPCSFAQERIWQSARTAEQPSPYAMCSVTSLHGPIDLEALRAALEYGVARHEPLRTTFVEREGVPLQLVHPPGHLDIPLTDLTGDPDPESKASELLREEAAAPMDLEHGPLLRFRLLRVSESEHRLLRVSHHLATDRRSWQIFVPDAIHAYESVRSGRPLPPPDDLQYADYAAWERRHMIPGSNHCAGQVAWWQHAFGPTPPTVQLPFARATPATDVGPEDGILWWGAEPAVTGALDELRDSEGATRYTVRLAIFSALLALEAGQDEVTVGTYIDNRRLAETESMFGDFSNLMTIILPFDPAASLRRWLPKVRFLVTEARARADLPYELLCDQLRAAQCTPPEVNILFALHQSLPELPCGDIELVPVIPTPLTMPWGFTFVIDQRREHDGCQVLFDAHLYDPVGVRRFIDRYIALAGAATARPDQPLSDLHADL